VKSPAPPSKAGDVQRVRRAAAPGEDGLGEARLRSEDGAPGGRSLPDVDFAEDALDCLAGLRALEDEDRFLVGEKDAVLDERRIVQVERGAVFDQLAGGLVCARAQRDETLHWVFSLFPILKERRQQLAHSLSGGEQQMLAIARGLMSRPKFLMIDEPLLGLAPLVVTKILEIIRQVNTAGVTVLFIEQNVQLALGVSHRGYLMESGRMVLSGTAQEVLESELVRKVYLGI